MISIFLKSLLSISIPIFSQMIDIIENVIDIDTFDNLLIDTDIDSDIFIKLISILISMFLKYDERHSDIAIIAMSF